MKMKKAQPINMKIDTEIWRAVSVRAAEQGIMKRELVERALTNYLNEKEIIMKFENPEYFVNDQYGTDGDEYIFSTAQEAVEYAESEWNHLVSQDKKRHVITAGVREKGTFDYDDLEIFGGD